MIDNGRVFYDMSLGRVIAGDPGQVLRWRLGVERKARRDKLNRVARARRKATS